jgi:hypothetical protein
MRNQPLPFDANDFSLQARSALHALQHAQQVVINAGALLEQELRHPLDPPAPRRFLYPREPEKTAATVRAATIRAASAPGAGAGPDQGVAAPAQDTSEARLLCALHARPPAALLDTAESAVYLNCSAALLRSWRWQKRGPAFEGSGRMVRYRKFALDEFMSA